MIYYFHYYSFLSNENQFTFSTPPHPILINTSFSVELGFGWKITLDFGNVTLYTTPFSPAKYRALFKSVVVEINVLSKATPHNCKSLKSGIIMVWTDR